MTRRHCSKLSAISAIQIIFIVGLSAGQRGNEKPDALKGFPDRVDMYIDLQRKAESGLPPFKETDSPEKMDAHRVTLASAIRAARAHAKPDDILNGASEQFRAIISEDARERSARDSLAAMQGGSQTHCAPRQRRVPSEIGPRDRPATDPETPARAP